MSVKYVIKGDIVEFPDEYDLWYREIVLKGSGLIKRIYFFVKEGREPKNPEACTRISDKILPAGHTIVYGPKNKHPFLKKIKE
jgi:hypothetical protein